MIKSLRKKRKQSKKPYVNNHVSVDITHAGMQWGVIIESQNMPYGTLNKLVEISGFRPNTVKMFMRYNVITVAQASKLFHLAPSTIEAHMKPRLSQKGVNTRLTRCFPFRVSKVKKGFKFIYKDHKFYSFIEQKYNDLKNA